MRFIARFGALSSLRALSKTPAGQNPGLGYVNVEETGWPKMAQHPIFKLQILRAQGAEMRQVVKRCFLTLCNAGFDFEIVQQPTRQQQIVRTVDIHNQEADVEV